MQTLLLWVATLTILILMAAQPKKLYIITGPPGSGKTTYAASLHYPIYDHDLGNKAEWPQSNQGTVTLTTSAPSAKNKFYWEELARRNGFNPVIVVMWLPRMEAFNRMSKRSGLRPTERNDLTKEVQRWYKLYSRHPREERVTI